MLKVSAPSSTPASKNRISDERCRQWTALRDRLSQFGELGAKFKREFGSDRSFVDGTKQPAQLSHEGNDADCTLVVSPDDLAKIMAGQLDSPLAFMTGKLKAKGNTAIAMKLAGMLKQKLSPRRLPRRKMMAGIRLYD